MGALFQEFEDAIDDVLRGGAHDKNGQSHDENMVGSLYKLCYQPLQYVGHNYSVD